MAIPLTPQTAFSSSSWQSHWPLKQYSALVSGNPIGQYSALVIGNTIGTFNQHSAQDSSNHIHPLNQDSALVSGNHKDPINQDSVQVSDNSADPLDQDSVQVSGNSADPLDQDSALVSDNYIDPLKLSTFTMCILQSSFIHFLHTSFFKVLTDLLFSLAFNHKGQHFLEDMTILPLQHIFTQTHIVCPRQLNQHNIQTQHAH